ncbi:MAG: hypothetical protein H7Y43_09260 [Akkermansiaceae bacterium]|nr:hypothetical protein [Verrucomicrobiales bacterium]
MNGQDWGSHPTAAEIITRQSQIKRPSEKMIFVEENDPRQENWGTWVMNINGVAANQWAGSTILGFACSFSRELQHVQFHGWSCPIAPLAGWCDHQLCGEHERNEIQHPAQRGG